MTEPAGKLAASTGDSALDQLVAEWLQHDRDPATRAEIAALVSAGNAAELRARLASRMSFGTAGLRAAMGAGFSRMNQLTVIQASQGLCKYVLESVAGDAAAVAVVVGYDARHHSREFAERTAVAFRLQGVQVHLFSAHCPTPYVAFAVTELRCQAGIMVTASHNPKEDNGFAQYKVYWGNGAQIISPHDAGISKHISNNLVPWDGAWDSALLGSCTDPLSRIDAAYTAYVAGLRWPAAFDPAAVAQSNPGFVYTAMHGVGYSFVETAFKAANLPAVIPVAAQVQPDPDFPTVEYPNPEEGKGALNLAFATADAAGASVILANDPDADRLAVAAKHQGQWRIFSGNEIGALLGWYCWHRHATQHPDAAPENQVMLSSSVSSMILRTIAKKEGFYFEDTLTGFKWMGNRARTLQDEGKNVLFAFEEAIGFAVGGRVVDKDGVSAAVVLAELALHLHAQGKTLVDALDDVFLRYGYHCSKVSYFICHVPETIAAIFAAVRAAYPKAFGPYAVHHVRDVTTGYDSREVDQRCRLPVQSGQMVTFYLDHATITLRTSGTEPKIKYYAEIAVPPTAGDDMAPVNRADIEAELGRQIAAVVDAVLQPARYGLVAKKE